MASASEEATVPRTEEYSSQLAEGLNSLREDKAFCDLHIRVGDHSFPCHRVILAAYSDVLREMLSAQTTEVDLSYISKEVIPHLLNYMYTGEAEVPEDLLLDTIEACESLQIFEFKELCINKSLMFLKIDNVFSWYELAIKLDHVSLKALCHEFMAAHFVEISKHKKFINLNVEKIMDCFSAFSSINMKSHYMLDASIYRCNHYIAEIFLNEDPSMFSEAIDSALHLRELIREYHMTLVKTDDLLDKLFEAADDLISHDPTNVFLIYIENLIKEYQENSTMVKSDDLLNGAIDWIRHDLENRSVHILPLLGKVNVKNVSVQCIQHHLNVNSDIIASSEETYTTMKDNLQLFDNAKEVMVVVGGEYTEGGMNHSNSLGWYLTPSNDLKELCHIPPVCNHKFSIFKEISSPDICQEYSSICQTAEGFAVTGGVHSSACKMFSLGTKSWTDFPKLPHIRLHHASICINGLLYVFGGTVACCSDRDSGNDCSCDDQDDAASVDILNIKEKTWTEGPSLPVGVGSPVVAAIESNIYLFDRFTNTLFELNTETNSWRSRAPFPPGAVPDSDCRGFKMTSAVGRLNVAGDNVLAWYTPSTDSWSVGNSPNADHSWRALTYYHDKLYLLGGDETDEVEEYDLETQEWTMSPFKMPIRGFRLGYAFTITIN